MEWAGSSYFFKKIFETGHLPPQVTIGHPDCGWTVRAVNENLFSTPPIVKRGQNIGPA
jgi:hypothetical protein